jgi:hypothetical protein
VVKLPGRQAKTTELYICVYYMCPHNTIYISVLMQLYACVLIILYTYVSSYYYIHMCPHTTNIHMCPHTIIYLCPHTTIYICVLIILYAYVSSYYYMHVSPYYYIHVSSYYDIHMCPHTIIYVCPHTTIYMSVLILLYLAAWALTPGKDDGASGGGDRVRLACAHTSMSVYIKRYTSLRTHIRSSMRTHV